MCMMSSMAQLVDMGLIAGLRLVGILTLPIFS